jgi:DNA-directed RNA polymerase
MTTAPNDMTPESLIDVQLRLETEMTDKGIARYMKQVSDSKQQGTEDKLAAAQVLMQHHTSKLQQAISEWLTEASAGKAGNNNIAYKYIKDLDPAMVAYVTLKKLLSRVSVPVMVQGAASQLGTALEDEVKLAKVREDERKTYDSIIRGTKKRVSDHYKKVYAMRRASESVSLDMWPEVDRVHVGMKLIGMAIETLGWFSVQTRSVGSKSTKKYLVADVALVEQMESNHHITSMLRPVYEPMVVQPRDWTTPHDGGYLSSNIRPIKLVKISSKGYYEELETTEMPVVYAAVNALQRTAWQINTKVLEVLTQMWELGHDQAGLPARLPPPFPVKPWDIETNEEARKDWKNKTAKVHQHITQERSKRASVAFGINVATRYNSYARIYMPYQLDFRGRIYAVPSFNPQGPDFMKALLRFSAGKPLGANGAQWLAMQGSNVAGNDKVSLEARVQWVLDNEEAILACAAAPLENKGWCTEINGQKIDKPWQFLAFCFEWAGYCEFGEAFVSKIAVALDGSCSGLQHFSALLRDERGGSAVNLTPSDTPQDVYGLVAEKVNISLEAIVTSEVSQERDDRVDLAQQWLTFGVDRKVCKRAVMTLSYGSTQYGFKDQLLDDVLTPAFAKAEAARQHGETEGVDLPFSGDGYKAAIFMAAEIWNAVTATLVKSVEAMAWLQQAASAVSAEGLPVRWTTPVGFPVMQAYWDIKERRVTTSLQGGVIKVTLGEHTDVLDTRHQRNGISPNVVHSLDASHMMLTTVRAEQEHIKSFSMIHDSFGTTAAETEDLFRIVRESFVEMYEETDVFRVFRGEILRQLSPAARKELPNLPEPGTLDLRGVLDSKFCFA